MDYETFVRDYLRTASGCRQARILLAKHGIDPYEIWRRGSDAECEDAALLLRKGIR